MYSTEWKGRRLRGLVVFLLCTGLLGADKAASLWPPFSWLSFSKTPRPGPSLVLPDAAETAFIPVAPRIVPEVRWQPTPGQTRAVVLIHGFHVLPFQSGAAARAKLHTWQKPGSKLVETLARQADVFAFAYSQNVDVEQIPGTPALMENLRRLRLLGYHEIVLLGHSAGGLIAREIVEDSPNAGVTKVIQVCTPNGGTNYAQLGPGFQKEQRPFVRSLTKEARNRSLTSRAGRRIPGYVQFVCVIGDAAGLGDGIVSAESQWPADLQAQGIPALFLRTTHLTVVRSQSDVQRLAKLVRDPIPRWTAAQVAQARKKTMRHIDALSSDRTR